MIVTKAVKMAQIMNIPIIGLVENMSYFRCPDNGKDYKIFGESHIDEIAALHNIEVLAQLPIEPKFSAMCDKGLVELFEGDWLEKAADKLEMIKGKTEEKKMIKIAVASEENMVSGISDIAEVSTSTPWTGGRSRTANLLRPRGRDILLSERSKRTRCHGRPDRGIGTGAVNMLGQSGIEVVSACPAKLKQLRKRICRAKLVSAGSNCQSHEHADGEGCGASCGGSCH